MEVGAIKRKLKIVHFQAESLRLWARGDEKTIANFTDAVSLVEGQIAVK